MSRGEGDMFVYEYVCLCPGSSTILQEKVYALCCCVCTCYTVFVAMSVILCCACNACVHMDMCMNLQHVCRPVWGKAESERTQAAEHIELAICPSPHIWCAGAGSGFGRRSDQPNEISQHTKCLSGPIRIPSCLPWVYLIEGKLTGSKRSKAPFGLAHTFLDLAWIGLGRVGMGWVELGLPSTVTPQGTCFTPLFMQPLLLLFISVFLARHSLTSSVLHPFLFFIFLCPFINLAFLIFTCSLSFSLSPFLTSLWDLGNF